MKTALQIAIGLCTLAGVACTNNGGGSSQAPPPPPPPVVAANTSPVPPLNAGYDPNMIMNYGYVGMNNGTACNTGTHTVKYSEYCTLLQDEGQNQNCAADQRKMAYNENCVMGKNITGGVQGQFLMPAGSAGYCRVSGVRDENVNVNMNRNLSVQSFIPWNGSAEQNFVLSDLNYIFRQYYGGVALALSPAGTTAGPLGKMTVVQRGGAKYTAVSKFSSRMTFEVGQFSEEKKVIFDCIPNSTLAQASAVDLTRITCQIGKGRPQEISWNTQSPLEVDLKSKEGEVRLSLEPAASGVEAMMKISAEQLDGDNDISAKSAVRSGLQIAYKDSSTGTQLTVTCAAASK